MLSAGLLEHCAEMQRACRLTNMHGLSIVYNSLQEATNAAETSSAAEKNNIICCPSGNRISCYPRFVWQLQATDHVNFAASGDREEA